MTLGLLVGSFVAPALGQTAKPSVTVAVQHIYSGPGTKAFVLATPDWCQDDVRVILHRPVLQGPEGYLGDGEMFGQAAQIAAAVRKRCPRMRTATVLGSYGPLDNLQGVLNYEGVYEENPRVAVLYETRDWRYFQGNEQPKTRYVLSKTEQATVAAGTRAEKDEAAARQQGKYGMPNVPDFQSYLTQAVATMLGNADISNNSVATTSAFGAVLERRTTIVDTVACRKMKSAYQCEVELRRTSGPSFFQAKETPWEKGSFTDTCSWEAPGRLYCVNVSAMVKQVTNSRERRGRSTTSPTETFDFDKHQKNVYCSSYGTASFAAFQFGGC
jgi:hypothetical protein